MQLVLRRHRGVLAINFDFGLRGVLAINFDFGLDHAGIVARAGAASGFANGSSGEAETGSTSSAGGAGSI